MASSDTAATTATLAPQATLDALRDGAVLRWWQTTAFLEVTGPDAPSFLDGLCTQAVERIEPGSAVAGLFLDAKAKIIAPAILHRVADADWSDPRATDATPAPAPRLLLETLPELVEPLHAHLKRYRLRAKATLEPVELATIALVGEHAPTEAPAVAPALEGSWSRVHEQAHPTLAFLGTADACRTALDALVADTGVGLADPAAFEADRIDRAVAGLHDLLPGRMPAEVGGMDAAVALDAGCYLGQEPVARLHYRGHANRTLRRLEADGAIEPASGDDVAAESRLDLHRADAPEGRSVGRLTTWAAHPDGRIVALAMLRREVAPGEPLRIPSCDATLRAVDAAPE